MYGAVGHGKITTAFEVLLGGGAAASFAGSLGLANFTVFLPMAGGGADRGADDFLLFFAAGFLFMLAGGILSCVVPQWHSVCSES